MGPGGEDMDLWGTLLDPLLGPSKHEACVAAGIVCLCGRLCLSPWTSLIKNTYFCPDEEMSGDLPQFVGLPQVDRTV